MKINNIRGDLTVKFSSKLNLFVFGYFKPVNIYFECEDKCFQGDLSNISAKTATLCDLIVISA